jgi:uncharacterized RDD family membrane protein YckC
VSKARASGTAASGQSAVRDPAAGRSSRPDEDEEEHYSPGERWGMPEEGRGSVAGFGRRLLALIIDWLACLVIATAVFRTHSQVQIWTLVFFAVETWLLTALTGFTLGKRLLSIRVARLDGRPVGFLNAFYRTGLLLLVVPPLALDKDLRGLHDKAAGTVVVRL